MQIHENSMFCTQIWVNTICACARDATKQQKTGVQNTHVFQHQQHIKNYIVLTTFSPFRIRWQIFLHILTLTPHRMYFHPTPIKIHQWLHNIFQSKLHTKTFIIFTQCKFISQYHGLIFCFYILRYLNFLEPEGFHSGFLGSETKNSSVRGKFRLTLSHLKIAIHHQTNLLFLQITSYQVPNGCTKWLSQSRSSSGAPTQRLTFTLR